MRVNYYVEFTDPHGSTVRYNRKFSLRADAEMFIRLSANQWNKRIVAENYANVGNNEGESSVNSPETGVRSHGEDVTAGETAFSIADAAAITKNRKRAALEKARAAKKVKREAALLFHVDQPGSALK